MTQRVYLCIVLVIGISCTVFEAQAGASESVAVLSTAPSPDTVTSDGPIHIQIESQTDCLDPVLVKASLEEALRPYQDATFLSVAVVEAPAVNGSAVALRVMSIDTGEIVLERSFTFNEPDCRSAHQVFRVVLEQFLSGFPIAEWKRENKKDALPPAPPPEARIEEVVVERCMLSASWRASLGLVARFPSPGGALEIGTGPDIGTKRNGFVGKLATRVSYPKTLENGRFLETHLLMGLGWRGTFHTRFDVRVYARVGGLYLKGFGFDRNLSRWRPWIDAQIILAWKVGISSLGIDVGASPLQYSVSVVNGREDPLAFLHAGLNWSIPVFFLSQKK